MYKDRTETALLSRTRNELFPWLGVLLVVLLVFGCLALVLINATQGFGPEGKKTTYRLEVVVSKYPNCAPDSECPAMVPADRNYLSVWFFDQYQDAKGVRIHYYRMINLPLTP